MLASPLAGWAAKQWPMENYHALADLLELCKDADAGVREAAVEALRRLGPKPS